MNKTIYMSEPLEKLAEQTKGTTARNGRFSARLSEIVERYSIIQELTDMPKLSDVETDIMSEVMGGGVVDRRKIRGLHLDVLDAAGGTDADRQQLSAKIAAMGAAERIMLVEGMGL
jgi:aspartate aminotransferase-like enzyme